MTEPPLARPPADASKKRWREWAKAVRRSLDGIESGRAIARRLERSALYGTATHILIYLAFANEPDLAPLLAARDKTFYTTRTEEPAATGGPSVLTLHRLDPDDLERHRFGFLQPSPLAPRIAAELIELALVPGLAFDVTGHRLGFGMGHYDRFLAGLGSSVARVGVAPSALLVPRLPFEEHDVRMTHLATESGVIPVEGDRGPDHRDPRQ